MSKIIKTIGIIGFVICLILMHMPGGSVQKIQAYEPGFKLFDMQLRYSGEQLGASIEKIGAEGRNAYRRYLMLDFVFIACFLITVLAIIDVLTKHLALKRILITLSVLRALFDIAENMLLLTIMNHYPIVNETLADICSWTTTVKFLVLFVQMSLAIFPRISRGRCSWPAPPV